MAAVTFDRDAVGNLAGVLAVAAMNDNWLKFSGQSDAVSAEVELDNGTTQKTFVITPDANKDFFFNVKEAVLSFFADAVDDYDYTADETDPSDLVQSIDFNVTISHTSSPNDTGTESAKFIKSKRVIPDSIFVASQNVLTDKLIKFEGYPLCVTVVEESGDVVRYSGGNGTWILEEGVFDDGGLWDDEEVWID